MSMQDQIKDAISAVVTIDDIKIINESHKHSGHAGDNGTGESHFRVEVISKDFENMSRIDRQRKIMESVKPLFSNGLHAFSVRAITPHECIQK